ncbi:hypothetical protein PALU110988_06525 [Paenibacillus lupini]|nr:hypothetical protein [Paenibacillus lupini]NIK23339.1 hypothetical protein [Paenibacillus lupini]
MIFSQLNWRELTEGFELFHEMRLIKVAAFHGHIGKGGASTDNGAKRALKSNNMAVQLRGNTQ